VGILDGLLSLEKNLKTVRVVSIVAACIRNSVMKLR